MDNARQPYAATFWGKTMNDHIKSNLQYQKRVAKALAYIRENMDRPISLEDVARAACFSPFHFHRIFRALMGEPLGEYITRKKLERAAIKLAYSPEATVTRVAFEYSYASVSGFSKAFYQWFGCRSTELKRIKDRLASNSGKLQKRYEKSIQGDQLFAFPSPDKLEEKFKAMDKAVEIKTIGGFNVYYLTSPDGYQLDSIRNTWQRLMEVLEDNHIDPAACDRFSISHDHPGMTPAAMCRYDACI